MNAPVSPHDAAEPADRDPAFGVLPRAWSPVARRFFLSWTAVWWGGIGLCGALFFVGVLDFPSSTRLSLYATSIWLNGWLVAWALQRRDGRSMHDRYHDWLVIWLLSYAMTNVLWEIPWVISSPFIFEDLHTLDDVVAQTDTMRSSVVQMYWWVMASFASVDLRTVNHDGTFYSVEIFAFVNIASTIYFFRLNARRSPYRYLVIVLGCGEPIAATFIFSFSEVFGGFQNMPGDLADTLLALVWTQYQYFVFPMIFGALGVSMLREDLRRHATAEALASTSGRRP